MHKAVLQVAALAVLGATSFAQTFSVSGTGGAIPQGPGTGGPSSNWQATLPVTAAQTIPSTVTVAAAVTSVTAFTLHGFSHTARGDVMALLTDPNGLSHNLFCRQGLNTTTGFGSLGSYGAGAANPVGGDFTFVETGGATMSVGNTDELPGTYNQFFGGTVTWNDGNFGIFNTPMSQIAGPAGTWTLVIYDWAGGDTGTFSGWTLDGTSGPTSAFNAFCAGDGSLTDHTTPCPCGNNGAVGNGCGHSFDANGANLSATGTPSLDDVVLHSQFEPVSSFTLMMQHASAGDTIFHDGVLCAGNPLIRLRGRAAVAGEAFFPNSNFAQDSTTTLSIRGGVTIGSGARRYYAAWYRNASSTFCPPATANVTNGWMIDW